ncbi:MAG: hypothetical protein QME12_03180 [Nanoarchaeota archaeon]|nr:hypothetical protein [Nanoarchaeota archaeon]
MQECQLSLEDKVRNALVRRKASFIQKVMQSGEYKTLASEKCRIIMGCMLASGKSSAVAAMAQHYGKNIRDTYSDDLRQEELAAIIADEAYESPESRQEFGDAMAGTCGFVLGRICREDFKADIERLRNAAGARKNFVKGLMGYSSGISNAEIAGFLKEWFSSRKDFIAFEQDYVDAWKQLYATGSRLSDEADKKMNEEYGDANEEEKALLMQNGYIVAMQNEMTELRHYLLSKSAELEADEVFGKA